MASQPADRVLETSSTTGTGTLTLTGSITGYRTFASVGDGNTTPYCIFGVDSDGIPTGEWETGIGTYASSGTTLARTTVQASSNSNNAVNFSAGTKYVASSPTVAWILSGVMTLTNKRITPRVTAITSSATPTFNTDDCDFLDITALAVDITSMTSGMTGTPTRGQRLTVSVLDNSSLRTIAWGSGFEAKGVALPTTTVAGKVLTVGFIWSTVTSKWGCVASAQEA